MSRPQLSVIVPVYNEEEMLADCLRTLVDQDDPVDEIVVVDNNSTDASVAVAEALADQFPVIRVMRAREQGVINARSEGFDEAVGDVLARVDADTRVTPSWARTVRDFFLSHGNRFAAGSGLCSCHDLPWQGVFRRQQRRISDSVAASLADGDESAAESPRLFGSNMAIDRQAWETVRADRSRSTDVFEDLDLSLTLEAAGYRMGLIPHADAQISGRRFLSPPRAYLRYCWRDQRTLRRRGHIRRAWRAVGDDRARADAVLLPHVDPVPCVRTPTPNGCDRVDCCAATSTGCSPAGIDRAGSAVTSPTRQLDARPPTPR
ncbi:MAG: glycosyltransferase family 2 protein [Gordonia paraffinivorans]